MRPLLALALLVGLAPAAPVPKAAKKPDDKAALVGTWKVTLFDGKNQNIHTHTYVFDADGGVQMLFGKNGLGNTSEWAFTLDTDATPKRMKWVRKGNDGGKYDCIYELSGDTLKLGFITGAKAVPEKVEVTPGVTLYEMTRDPATK